MGLARLLRAFALIVAPSLSAVSAIYDPADILIVEANPIGGGPPQIVAVDPVTEEAVPIASGGMLSGPEHREKKLCSGLSSE